MAYGIGMSLPEQAQFAQKQGMAALGSAAKMQTERDIANRQIQTQTRQSNAQLGATAGSVAGSFFGPIGTVVGGVLGGLIGGLF